MSERKREEEDEDEREVAGKAEGKQKLKEERGDLLEEGEKKKKSWRRTKGMRKSWLWRRRERRRKAEVVYK